MTRRIAVTGATGFIGRHVVAHLAARGDDVRAIVRPASTRKAPDAATEVRTPFERDALADALADTDVVVHLAGVVSAPERQTYMAANVDATAAVAHATAATGARLVHVSSLAAAGPAPASAPRLEDDECRPINWYGESKLGGERAIAAVEQLHWMALRPGVVYGPGDRAVLALFRIAKHGWLPHVGERDAAYSFVFIDDLVAAVAAAIDRFADRGVFFVAHPTPVTADRLAHALETALARPVRLIHLPHGAARLAAGAADLVQRIVGRTLPFNRRRFDEMSAEGFVCRVDRLRERLGVEPRVDLPEGFARTAVWYREHGWM
jgi:nucleoside-diphosphate-sugar epimerase